MTERTSGPLKPGDEVKTWAPYRFVPLGIISAAIWGLQFLAIAIIMIGLVSEPGSVLGSFQGEGAGLWAICVLVWLGLLALNLGLGHLLSQRKITVSAAKVTLHRAFGREKDFLRGDIAKVHTVYSTAALMQGVVHLKYRDGTRAVLDGSGFNGRDLERVVHFLASR